VIEAGGAGIVSAAVSLPTAGVYYVTLTVSDDDDGLGTTTLLDGTADFVVIYDPSGSFVTGFSPVRVRPPRQARRGFLFVWTTASVLITSC